MFMVSAKQGTQLLADCRAVGLTQIRVNLSNSRRFPFQGTPTQFLHVPKHCHQCMRHTMPLVRSTAVVPARGWLQLSEQSLEKRRACATV